MESVWGLKLRSPENAIYAMSVPALTFERHPRNWTYSSDDFGGSQEVHWIVRSQSVFMSNE
jgi:hypothetical protein